MNDLVTIITPSYNSEKFIGEAIQSVLNQTYANWEMIIVDDCSTDNTLKLIHEYLKKDARIKLFENGLNCGAAVCRNIGLENATGRFIAFIDSDDLWISNKLELQLNFMLNNNYEISFTNYELVDESSKSLNKSVNSVLKVDYRGYLKNTIIGMSTSMIDSSKTGVFKFTNLRTRQDTYLWISLLKKGFNAYGIDSTLAKYRVRKDSISANKISAAKQVWYLYYSLEKLGFITSVYYFTFYAYNAVKKRFNIKYNM
jgi:teichuronic acid biosynthesis glycosyltransferase TuaG